MGGKGSGRKKGHPGAAGAGRPKGSKATKQFHMRLYGDMEERILEHGEGNTFCAMVADIIEEGLRVREEKS